MEEITKTKKWHQKWWGILIVLVLLLGLFLGVNFAWQFWQEYQDLQSGLPAFSELEQQTELTGVVNINGNYVIIPTVDDDPYLGPEDAKVTVISFQSFECPYCQQEFPIYRKIMEKYKDRVKFVWRDFEYPATIPAMAGECAEDQGKFWELHDKMFGNQANITEDNVKLWASDLGMNMIGFENCLYSEKHKWEVEKDFQDGQYAGVVGTPSFFVNGYKIQGTVSEEAWTNLLDHLLNLTN